MTKLSLQTVSTGMCKKKLMDILHRGGIRGLSPCKVSEEASQIRFEIAKTKSPQLHCIIIEQTFIFFCHAAHCFSLSKDYVLTFLGSENLCSRYQSKQHVTDDVERLI